MTDINTVDLDTVTDIEADIGAVEQRLERARGDLIAAGRSLTARAPSLAELHAAVDGTIRVSTALADLVATVMRQAPPVHDHTHQGVLSELLADLRAMHGCLTTGPLLAPARDALHLLGARQHAGTADAPGPENAPDSGPESGPGPDPDRVGRPCLGRAESADAVRIIHGVADVLEADLADVADQHRDAPLVDEGEPWH